MGCYFGLQGKPLGLDWNQLALAGSWDTPKLGALWTFSTHSWLCNPWSLISFSWPEGVGNQLSGIQDKETMTWKYVDGKALSSMGLTSSVRKVV